MTNKLSITRVKEVFEVAVDVIQYYLSLYDEKKCNLVVVGNGIHTNRLFSNKKFKSWKKIRQIHMFGKEINKKMVPVNVHSKTHRNIKTLRDVKIMDSVVVDSVVVDSVVTPYPDVVIEILSSDAIENRADIVNVPSLTSTGNQDMMYFLISPFRPLSVMEKYSVEMWYPWLKRHTFAEGSFDMDNHILLYARPHLI